MADRRGLRVDTALGVDPDDEGDLLPEGGELAAERRLGAWLDLVDDYEARRDLPADDTGTSHLSSDLRFGTLSPRHVVDVVGTSTPGRAAFVRQLAWRDWYAHLLTERPELAHAAMKPGLDDVVWRDDPDGFEAWRTGRTGYPIVDAGMRQLAATGWMHNRVRMITASFLVKDLLVDWRLGEAHFRHELIDAEVSQNAGNWQWVAGTGPDAAPYFRIFNPVTQSRRFDPTGAYLRRWVPELRGLDDRSIHAPWEVGPLDLAAAGVHLGDEYPWPIVDHAQARDRTLAAYGAAAGR
jgi:deoxyribodipyrimidine photo-lyase